VSNLKLGPQEAHYFETLIDLQRSKSLEEKQLYSDRLTELSPSTDGVRLTEVEVYKSIKDPLHSLLLEMTTLDGFQNDLRWIQKRMFFDVSIEKIKETLDRLLSLGLLLETHEGGLKRSTSNVINPTDVPSQGIRELHRNSCLLAAEAVTTQAVHDRDFNSLVLNVSPNCLPEAKKEIREFILKFAEKFEAKTSTHAQESFGINVHFFKLTQNKEN
jgi:uncharacterized protein (TIGR02147 family)